ncbi:unnamed protein product [Rotaria magnacalcarata]|uniref:Uncharacterized protein n=1 Tax=Rotaria magnacalcarata TaxID=392030 RepID=A0A8S2QCQ4_9BILA|nr:unnamed protein product [Rotaria magnacalcarata]
MSNVYEIKTCAICCDSLSKEVLVTTKCQHTFHLQCLKLSVEANNQRCPLCQDTMTLLVSIFGDPKTTLKDQTKKDDLMQPKTVASMVRHDQQESTSFNSWTCKECTLANTPHVTLCDACETPRTPLASNASQLVPNSSYHADAFSDQPIQSAIHTVSISVPSYTSASASLKCYAGSPPPLRVGVSSHQLTEQAQQCPDQLPTEWECQVCTFYNSNDDKRCIICHEGIRPERRPQVMRTDSVIPVSGPVIPQPTSTIIGTVLEYVVWIPDLPADINAAELERMIDLRLNSNHHIKVNKVTCHSSIGVGIVYVSNTTEKDALLNTVRSTVLDPKKDIIISFVRQLELVSYLVFDQKKKQTEIAVEVSRRWAQLSKSPQLPACEQISVLFPNIFKITSRSLDELLAIRTLDIFKVNEQFANVYLRADCSFVEDLPDNIATTQITTAIITHIGGQHQYDQQTLYVQYNKEASSAIILAANAALSTRFSCCRPSGVFFFPNQSHNSTQAISKCCH